MNKRSKINDPAYNNLLGLLKKYNQFFTYYSSVDNEPFLIIPLEDLNHPNLSPLATIPYILRSIVNKLSEPPPLKENHQLYVIHNNLGVCYNNPLKEATQDKKSSLIITTIKRLQIMGLFMEFLTEVVKKPPFEQMKQEPINKIVEQFLEQFTHYYNVYQDEYILKASTEAFLLALKSLSQPNTNANPDITALATEITNIIATDIKLPNLSKPKRGGSSPKFFWNDQTKQMLASEYHLLLPIWSKAHKISKLAKATDPQQWTEHVFLACPELTEDKTKDLIQYLGKTDRKLTAREIALEHAARKINVSPWSYKATTLYKMVKEAKIKGNEH